MKSPICPSPPALTTTDSDDSVCSVDGYVDDRFSAMVEPGCSLPVGGSPSGRVQGNVHRSQQAGLADGRDSVGRDGDIRPHPDLDIGDPVVNVELADASHDDIIDHDR